MKKLLTSIVMVPFFILSVPDNQLMSEKFEHDDSIMRLANVDLKQGLMDSEEINYEKAIDFIKNHEGYADGVAYTCVSGNLTIGYGHVIKDGEKFPQQISLEYADSLLREDFAKAYAYADEMYPEIWGGRKMAITHFIYSKGIGAFLRSGLKQKIDSNGNVDEEFMRWCYYTDSKTGNKIYSKVAAGIQTWEKNMWHADDELYAKSEGFDLLVFN